MDKIVFDANVELEKNSYNIGFNDFKSCVDKQALIDKFKSHNMRFSLLIIRNIACEKEDNDYVGFLDSVIDSMTQEITLLNDSVKNGSINEILDKFSFHKKVNIIFYVRPNFYDSSFDTYEVLNNETFKILSDNILECANSILSKYGKTLKEVSEMNPLDVHKLISDSKLCEDILFASELVK
jgi:hypothetical protein